MNAYEIRERVENLLSAADSASMDLNRRKSALERAEVWIKYLAVQAEIEARN